MVALLLSWLVGLAVAAAPVTLVLPSGYVAATEGLGQARAIGDALAHLSFAAQDAPGGLPHTISFVPLSQAPVSSHVLVLDGLSYDALEDLSKLQSILSGRATQGAYCEAGGASCLQSCLSTNERLADRVLRVSSSVPVMMSTTSTPLAQLLAPRRTEALVPAVPVSVDELTSCGADAADIAALNAVAPAAAAELALICHLSVDPLTSGLTIVPVSSVSDIRMLEGDTRAAGIRVADAVLSHYVSAAEHAPRTVVSLVFSAARAIATAEDEKQVSLAARSRKRSTVVSAGRTSDLVTPDEYAAQKQILIWFPVVLAIILIASLIAMFGVGVDACKDTLLFRTTTTFH